MSDLAARLAGLDPDAQAKAADEYAPSASTEELIRAVRVLHRDAQGAEMYIVHELTHRGPSLVEPVAQALLADPVALGAGSLGEALVQLYQSEPAVRSRVAATLIEAVNAALDAGSGSRGAASSIQLLADCATIAGPLPEAEPAAQRLLATAAGEPEPYKPAMAAAQHLARGGRGRWPRP